MNTRKFTGDMADQVEKDRDELVELRAKCERLEGALVDLQTEHDMQEPRRIDVESHLTDILERLEEARRLLEFVLPTKEWRDRREAWLKGGQP